MDYFCIALKFSSSLFCSIACFFLDVSIFLQNCVCWSGDFNLIDMIVNKLAQEILYKYLLKIGYSEKWQNI